MLLMIDNYDSFTYNLVQYFGELGEDVRTYRNDEITLDGIAKLNPERICLSPGPSNPQHAGITLDVLREFSGKLPILGVCLGHQAIGEAFGGRVVRAQTIMHGKVSEIETDCKGVFADLPKHFKRDALSLARDRARIAAGLPGNIGVDARRRNHGRAPQGTRGRRRAIPPGIDPVRARPRAARKLRQKPGARQARVKPTNRIDHDHYCPGSAATHDRASRDFPRRNAAPDAHDHARRDVAGHGRRDHHGFAREEGNHRRDRGGRDGDARIRESCEVEDN